MSAPDHRRVQELFHEASALDAGARAAFLAAKCGGDQALRDEVLSLLAATGPAEDFLEDTVEDLLDPGPDRPRAEGDLPDQIGGYRIVGSLGRGGMGVVYEALDPNLGRRVALKVLPPTLAGDARTIERFRKEARMLASLNHPGIATIYSLEDAEGLTFFTLERIEGETLGERLARGPFGVAESVRVAREIARALEAAHERGIVHCDLKPGNVMLTVEERVKVLDFGIAHAIGEFSDEGAPTGMLLATPGYASPEQLQGGVVDAATDVWALGCILYECLAGERPFAGSSLMDVLRRTAAEAPEWSRLGTSGALLELVQCCLEKDPRRRPADVATVRRALDAALAGQRHDPRPIAAPREVGKLPRPLTRFVGRDALVARVREQLAKSALVTLTGVGGGGKSRLAIEVARIEADPERFHDGAWFVELAPVGDPGGVVEAVAGVLGVGDAGGGSTADALAEHLAQRRLFLVLDNCEHVLGTCAELVEQWLTGAPGLRVLATSRESLGVPGECVSPVPPLSLPADTESGRVEDSEAVQLFVERAGEARPGFVLDAASTVTVGEICRRLDGIPLAIELAAARARAFPLEEIATRLDDRFRLLTGGARTALPRQKTLRGAMDWSYDLLDEPERVLLARLSVFHGGATLEAIERVGAGGLVEGWDVLDLVDRLVDKSLVELDPEAFSVGVGARYRLLETVRQYGAERLAGLDDVAEVYERFRGCYRDLVASASAHYMTEREPHWLEVLGRERGNIGEAIAGWRDAPDGLAQAMDFARGMTRYWEVRGELSHGLRVANDLLARPATSDTAEARAKLGLSAGELVLTMGHFDQARACYEESLRYFQGIGDREFVSRTRNMLGNLLRHQGEFERAEAYYESALEVARELGSARQTAGLLGNLGGLMEEIGDVRRARELGEESLALLRGLGDARGVAVQLNNLGVVALREGDFDRAHDLFRESLLARRSIHDARGTALALRNLGELELTRERSDVALDPLREARALYVDVEDRDGVAACDVLLGSLALSDGELETAVACFRGGFATYRDEGNPVGLSVALDVAGWTAVARAEMAVGARLIGGAERLCTEVGLAQGGWRLRGRARAAEHARAALGEEDYEAARAAGAVEELAALLAAAQAVLG